MPLQSYRAPAANSVSPAVKLCMFRLIYQRFLIFCVLSGSHCIGPSHWLSSCGPLAFYCFLGTATMLCRNHKRQRILYTIMSVNCCHGLFDRLGGLFIDSNCDNSAISFAGQCLRSSYDTVSNANRKQTVHGQPYARRLYHDTGRAHCRPSAILVWLEQHFIP